MKNKDRENEVEEVEEFAEEESIPAWVRYMPSLSSSSSLSTTTTRSTPTKKEEAGLKMCNKGLPSKEDSPLSDEKV